MITDILAATDAANRKPADHVAHIRDTSAQQDPATS
jgi:hypothetical protein